MGDKLVPRYQLKGFNLELRDEDIDIELDGSLFAWAADVFLYFFKWILLPTIVDTISEEVPKTFNYIMDEFAKETGGLLEIPYVDLGVDFSYSSPEKVSPTHLQLFFNGTVFPASQGEVVPSLGYAVMEVNKDTNEAI